MPDITLNQMLPSFPTHWTSIFHYIILLATLFILMSSRSDVSIIFIIVLGALAMATGADLYAERIPAVGCFAIFMFHAAMVGLPLLLGGLSPSEETRGIAVVTGLAFGVPLFASLFLGYFIDFLGDPRYMRVCG
jgi:hypothetical protein